MIYELLLHRISTCLVEKDTRGSQSAIKILKKHFKSGTELYKEFRLFNALVKTTVSAPGVATSILREAKQASRSLDLSKLEKEKSALIRDINYKIGSDFYNGRVNEYRTYATIQTLLNDWRLHENADLSRMAKYESHIVSWLITEKNEIDILSDDDLESDALIVKIMTEKLNKKFNSVFNDEQKDIVREYIFSTSKNSYDDLREKLIILKQESLEYLDSYLSETSNAIISEKSTRVRDRIFEESLDDINDATIERFLLLSQLRHELEVKE